MAISAGANFQQWIRMTHYTRDTLPYPLNFPQHNWPKYLKSLTAMRKRLTESCISSTTGNVEDGTDETDGSEDASDDDMEEAAEEVEGEGEIEGGQAESDSEGAKWTEFATQLTEIEGINMERTSSVDIREYVCVNVCVRSMCHVYVNVWWL